MSAKISLAAGSAIAGGLGLFAALSGPLGARLGLWHPLIGFAVFAAGIGLGGGLGFIGGLLGLLRSRRRQDPVGRSYGLIAIVLALAMLGSAGSVLLLRETVPIHDITSDPADPVDFIQAVHHPDNQGRDLSYPHGGADVIELQRRHYPDIAPIRLSLPADEAFDRALAAAAELRWTITWQNRGLGRFEAFHQTVFFGFLDDVAVRVRAAGSGSIVDVRSTSRVGVSDFGTNARRIRGFAQILQR